MHASSLRKTQEKWSDITDETAETPDQSDSKGPKEGSIATYVDYYTNDKGQKVKVTRVVKLVKKPARVNKHIAARRKWEKFGDCKGLPAGPEENITHKSHEIKKLDLRPRLREDDDDQKEEKKDLADHLAGQGQSKVVVCHNCGEPGHWSLKCPKRNTINPTGMDSEPDLAKPPKSSSGASDETDSSADGKNRTYVPLHRRLAESARGERDRDDATLRVTNLSEDTTEVDLQDLFRRFGNTSRIYLAKDKQTFRSRGFAFVSFYRREDAQQAIDKLNGWGYDNLILQVEWAKPQAPRPAGQDEEGGGGRGRGGGFGGFGRGGGGRGGGGGGQRPRLQLQPRTIGNK